MSLNLNVPELIESVVSDYINNNKNCLVGQPKNNYCLIFSYDNNYDSQLNLPDNWNYNTSPLSETTVSTSTPTSSSNEPSGVDTVSIDTWTSELLSHNNNDNDNDGKSDTIQDIISTDNGQYSDTGGSSIVEENDEQQWCDAIGTSSSFELPKAKAGKNYTLQVNSTIDNITPDDKVTLTFFDDVGYCYLELVNDNLVTIDNTSDMNVNGNVLLTKDTDTGNISGNIFLFIDLVAKKDDYSITYKTSNISLDYSNAIYYGDCDNDDNQNGSSSTTANCSYSVLESYTGEVNGDVVVGYGDMGEIATITFSNLDPNVTYKLSIVVGVSGSMEYDCSTSGYYADRVEVSDSDGNLLRVGADDGVNSGTNMLICYNSGNYDVSLVSCSDFYLKDETSQNKITYCYNVTATVTGKETFEFYVSGYTHDDINDGEETYGYLINSAKVECV